MKPISINFTNNTIVVTSAFAKKASDPSSKEFRELQKTLKTFPTFTVERHTIKKNPSKESYAGLTYAFMREYIETHVEVNKVIQALEDLEEQIYLTKCHSIKFPTVRKWFLATYPEIKDNYGKISETRRTVEIITSEDEFELCA